ncbi:hypothetical protein RR48_09349 [Papilio machaon]|uniref:Uncharacterized protein n=1 Tax=Papilio machaon TaxID=76193 RepID=A0A194RCJ4_PAPMA|nr:hypothetical protein RR48_09349 [Papilio machaon]
MGKVPGKRSVGRRKKILVAQHPRVDRGYECRPTISPRKGQKKIWRTDRQPSLVEEALQEEEEYSGIKLIIKRRLRIQA